MHSDLPDEEVPGLLVPDHAGGNAALGLLRLYTNAALGLLLLCAWGLRPQRLRKPLDLCAALEADRAFLSQAGEMLFGALEAV